MEKQLDYFFVDGSYGGSQDWFTDFWMHLGGCAAITACDSCIYFSLYYGMKKLCPFELHPMTRQAYIDFGMIMKPYLRPRNHGIDRLDIYVDGFGRYLRNRGETQIAMEMLAGDLPEAEAQTAVRAQIDSGFVIPCLTLDHKAPAMHDYIWHWYILNGYRETNGRLEVKAATYVDFRWLDFPTLWNPGADRKGGLILYRISEKK